VEAPEALPHPDDPEAARLLQPDAGLVLGEDPVWTVQMPARSAEAIRAASSARPTPWPWACGATSRLSSATPV